MMNRGIRIHLNKRYFPLRRGIEGVLSIFEMSSTLIILLFLAVLFLMTAIPLSAAAIITPEECGMLKLRGCGADPGFTIKREIYSAALAFLYLLSVIAFLIVVYCGAQYVMAGGDSGRAQQAKTCLLYAAIGLVIAGLSGWIVNAIINLGT